MLLYSCHSIFDVGEQSLDRFISFFSIFFSRWDLSRRFTVWMFFFLLFFISRFISPDCCPDWNRMVWYDGFAFARLKSCTAPQSSTYVDSGIENGGDICDKFDLRAISIVCVQRSQSLLGIRAGWYDSVNRGDNVDCRRFRRVRFRFFAVSWPVRSYVHRK